MVNAAAAATTTPARQVTLIARGVKSDVERAQAALAPALSMALQRWSRDQLQGLQHLAVPAAHLAAVTNAAYGEDAMLSLQSKVLNCINDVFAALITATSKTVVESAAAMTRSEDLAVHAEPTPPSSELVTAQAAGLPPTVLASKPDTPSSTVPLADAEASPSTVPSEPPQATSFAPLSPRHSRRAVKILTDGSTQTHTAALSSATSDQWAQTIPSAPGVRLRRALERIRLRLSLNRLRVAMARAADERCVLVAELVKLVAVAREASHALSPVGASLVARQLASWQSAIARDGLSNPTIQLLSSLDSASLRVVVDRANGRSGSGDDDENEAAAAAVVDVLSRPGWRKPQPDAPRRRVRQRHAAAQVQPADLLPTLPRVAVAEYTQATASSDAQSPHIHRSTSSAAGGIEASPMAIARTSRDSLKSRERARLGASSFFLCRRCGADARTCVFDPQQHRLRPLAANAETGRPKAAAAPSVHSVANSPAAVTVPSPPRLAQRAADQRANAWQTALFGSTGFPGTEQLTPLQHRAGAASGRPGPSSPRAPSHVPPSAAAAAAGSPRTRLPAALDWSMPHKLLEGSIAGWSAHA